MLLLELLGPALAGGVSDSRRGFPNPHFQRFLSPDSGIYLLFSEPQYRYRTPSYTLRLRPVDTLFPTLQLPVALCSHLIVEYRYRGTD
jgi:hypothetical protein